MLLEMGGLALNQMENALRALNAKDIDLARLVIRKDKEIQEVIARRAPVGSDLRMVLAASKSVTAFEEIGDNAVTIANLALRIYGNEDSEPSEQLMHSINRMGVVVLEMLQTTLSAYDRLDETAALMVIRSHEELDTEFQSGLRRLVTFVMEDSRNVGYMVTLALITKSLERVGDHAKKVAENVVFFVQGDDVRHGNIDSQNSPQTG